MNICYLNHVLDLRNRLNSTSSSSSSAKAESSSRDTNKSSKSKGDKGDNIVHRGRGSVGGTGTLATVTAANTTLKSLQYANKDIYLHYGMFNGKPTISQLDFTALGCPSVYDDNRASRCSYHLPRDRHPQNKLTEETIATCSNKGNTCHACSPTGNCHQLGGGARVVILGDEFFPALAGGNKDCLLVWRIQGGTFAEFKALINTQLHMGLQLHPGSIFVTCLMTHLFRLGEAGYWVELTDFIDWARRHFSMVVLPTLVVYQEGLPYKYLASIRRFYAKMQHRNFGGASVTKKDPLFGLWRPFFTTSEKTCKVPPGAPSGAKPLSKVDDFGAEPLIIKNGNKEPSYISCDGNFLLGAGGKDEWQGGMPPALEKIYLEELIKAIKEIHVNPNLVTPSKDSISAGLSRNTALIPATPSHQGRQMFVLGASIMEALGDTLVDLAGPAGVTIVPLCERGDFLGFFLKEKKDMLACLKTGTSRDLLFICPNSNNMLKYSKKEKIRKEWHLTNPSLLTDEEFDLALSDTNKVLDAIFSTFQGRVVVLGPFPRLLRDCCNTKAHQLRDERGKRVDMLVYTEAFSSLCHRGLDLVDNSTFVNFKEVFAGQKFNVSMLKDNVHLKSKALTTVANYCMQWLDRDSEELPEHDPEDPLPGLSEVLDVHKIATPSTNLADESSSSDDDENEPSSGQAALVKVRQAREMMAAKKALEEAANNPANNGGEVEMPQQTN